MDLEGYKDYEKYLYNNKGCNIEIIEVTRKLLREYIEDLIQLEENAGISCNEFKSFKKLPIQLIWSALPGILRQLYFFLSSNKSTFDEKTKYINIVTKILEFKLIKEFSMMEIMVIIRQLQILIVKLEKNGTPGINLNENVPEELKLAVTRLVLTLYKLVWIDIKKDIIASRDSAVRFTPMFFSSVCVNLVQYESLKKLRITALNCIVTLACADIETEFDTKHEIMLAESFTAIFPGIIRSCLLAIDDGKDKQGSKIILAGFYCLSRMTTLIMSDKVNPSLENHLLRKQSQLTPEWYAEALGYLKTKLEKVFYGLSVVGNGELDMEILRFCENVFTKCSKTLNSIQDLCLEQVIYYISSEKVGEKSRQIFDQLLAESGGQIMEKVELSMEKLVANYERTMIVNLDSHSKLIWLTSLKCYVRLLQEKNEYVIFYHLSTGLSKLLEALEAVAELDSTKISLLEQYPLKDFSQIENTYKMLHPWKTFTNLVDESLENEFYKVCESIGELDDEIETLIHLLLSDFKKEPRKETVLLINNLIVSSKQHHSNRIYLVDEILDAYLENWNIPTHDSKNNIIMTCLMVEGIGSFVITFDTNNYQQLLLLRSLHLILEKCGSDVPLISLAAIKTLNQIRIHFQHKNISELISHNADYLRHFIIQKLKQVERYPQVLNTLTFVMKFCSIEILPFLHEIISYLLSISCDQVQMKNSTIFLQLFFTFVNCILRWRETNPAEIIQPIEDIEYKNEESKIPFEIEMTVEVMKKCLHFLPTKNTNCKLLSLDTLVVGIKIIKNWENYSFRLAHLIWLPLVKRFDETDPLILHRSFNLLIALARMTNTFIRKRTLDEVIPKLLAFLKSSADESFLKDRGSAYRYTQKYKFQLSLLDQLIEVFKLLEINEKHILESAINSGLPFLSSRQPKPLQEKTVNQYFKLLISIDQSLVEMILLKWRDNPEFIVNISEICIKR